MILAVDVGNTNIVLGCIENGKIIFSGRLTTDAQKTDMELAVILNNIFSLNNINPLGFEGAIISSVVPPINKALKSAIKLITGKDAYEVHGCEDLKVAIDDPNQLGNDLVVGAVAVLDEFKPPIVLIDMGTATTIFVIDKDGRYLGGSIMPGIMISQKALSSVASLLPSISLDAPKSVIGANTVDSMNSGAVFGNASMLDGMIDRIESELGEKVTAVSTGGLSRFITSHCRHEIIYDEDLLLKGLWLIYQKHAAQNR
ncbi:MAG: type III pantothenate kinase [Firmicutes bacterium]|nr:type III pantothenate kinase [Bacillota bacterium]